MKPESKNRSFFWPVVLIGVGLVWLLSNMGIIPAASLALAWRLWPLIIIIIGLDLIFGRKTPLVGALVGVLAVALVVGILLFAPVLGWKAPEMETHSFSEALGNATTAELKLDLGSATNTINVLGDSGELITARIDHAGDVYFLVGGTDSSRTVSLGASSSEWTSWMPGNQAPKWFISLSPKAVWEMEIDCGSGSTSMDFTGLQVADLAVDIGSGSVNAILAQSSTGYNASFTGGSGSLHLTVPTGTNLTVQLDGGSGSISVELPAGAKVRVEAQDDGSGSLNLPKGLVRISGADEDRDLGVWESAGYETANYQVLILILDAGSGSINIQQ